jgi:hypothetical protein
MILDVVYSLAALASLGGVVGTLLGWALPWGAQLLTFVALLAYALGMVAERLIERGRTDGQADD